MSKALGKGINRKIQLLISHQRVGRTTVAFLHVKIAKKLSVVGTKCPAAIKAALYIGTSHPKTSSFMQRPRGLSLENKSQNQ